jgi:DNA-binding NtrC family response regulator
MKILFVDDEKSLRVAAADELRDAGYEVSVAACGEEALPLIEEGAFDLVITDLVMDKIGGLDVLSAAKRRSPTTEVILITAYATLETSIQALKGGAIDYLCKPFELTDMLHAVARVGETIRLKRENMELRAKLQERHQFHNIIGKSAAMQKVFNLLDIICPTDKTVIISGETGTGKQMVAEALHYNGSRRDKPFITLSCVSLSRDVLESEMFGHEKGAFTGAIREKHGKFELAHTGTLFLDDVDDMPLETQVKILGAIETGKFERVGGENTLSVDVRVVAATKQDLEGLVRAGKFRKDLFYRLNVIQITLPPLRERKEDIPLLVSHFLKSFCPDRSIDLAPEIMGHLLQYNWDGNVRELKHVVERLVLLAQNGRIEPDALPVEIKNSSADTGTFEPGTLPLPEYLYKIERTALIKALDICGGGKTKTADLLGIPLPTLKSKLEKFQLE